MKAIIFISTNKSGSSREAIRAAEHLGYFTILFTNNEKQIQQRQEYTDVHKMVSVNTNNLDKMREEISKLQTNGVDIKTIVSFVDPFVHTASILCDEFCHNYVSSKAIEIMENKEDTRLSLKDQPYTPNFFLIKPDESIPTKTICKQLDFPIIIKSPKSTGSKDVLLAEGEEQLEKHFDNLRNKNPDNTIMVEEYIDGDQYLVEALVHNHKARIVGIIEQEITKRKRFIITGYGVLANVPVTIRTGIENVLQSIVKELGIENGALHLEIRLAKNGWKLIEINPRISGGAMNKMIQAAFGFSLVEQTLKLLLGESPAILPKHKKYVFTKYIIATKKGILEKVTGKRRAKKSPGVVEVYVKPKKGTLLMPPLSMGHRYAYIIAVGSSLEEAKNLANTAAKEIIFHLEEE
ncbi:ATP-grasp domain-containing protein [Psychrobacillus glaciei]|uniref:ATP-grasp domain-containing protein n=1 Tax=Psychrobacillus glaciei TaxID=2283160 RepID=A0A5J6SI96_9BACI|nr:ATP-grasp domain-containing protein [Psychrobacillus glaciei]QFF97655.1 ATP-grasp domain-containing protein [Psychrobacillus glaciei]